MAAKYNEWERPSPRAILFHPILLYFNVSFYYLSKEERVLVFPFFFLKGACCSLPKKSSISGFFGL